VYDDARRRGAAGLLQGLCDSAAAMTAEQGKDNIMGRVSTRFLLCVGLFLLVGGYGLIGYAREQTQVMRQQIPELWQTWYSFEKSQTKGELLIPILPGSQWFMLGVIFMAIGAGFVGSAIPALIPGKQ
jgi:hypothetical protein